MVRERRDRPRGRRGGRRPAFTLLELPLDKLPDGKSLSGLRAVGKRKPGGFTLIELLIVISVIALLMGILIPVVGRAKVSSRRAVCATNLHAVGVGFQMYLSQSRDIMPVAAQMPSLKLNDDPPIAEVLAPHLPRADVLRCPADPDRKYFRSEGSSYEYFSMLGGRKVSESFLTRRWGEHRTPVMHDYEPFHGTPGQRGAANYLFADGHVGDME